MDLDDVDKVDNTANEEKHVPQSTGPDEVFSPSDEDDNTMSTTKTMRYSGGMNGAAPGAVTSAGAAARTAAVTAGKNNFRSSSPSFGSSDLSIAGSVNSDPEVSTRTSKQVSYTTAKASTPPFPSVTRPLPLPLPLPR